MSNIGTLIQAYQDKHGTSDRALATRIGVTATLIGRWKRGDFVELPKKSKIQALSTQITVSYDRLLEAFLLDIGYLGEEDTSDGAPMNVTRLSEPASRVAGEDLAGLPSVAHTPRKGTKNKD